MKTPPIDYVDLVALGMSPTAVVTGSAGGYAIEPQPPRLVRQLMRELLAFPAPDDKAAYLRHIRDLLIGLTDWTQAADSPLTDEQQAAWAIYRQALRDLPKSYSGEGAIPWPVAPA